MSDIERELESELHRVLDPLSALPIPTRRMPARGITARTVLGGAGAALSLKLLTGVVAAAAAVTVAGTVTTGSLNPVDWGQQVSQHVADCKAKLADGQHGIGDCVSSFANQHGTAVASDARHHGQDSGSGNGAGAGSSNSHGNNGNANDHAKDKSKNHPLPTPRASAAGDPEPSDPAIHPTVTVPPQH
jgi:hypothetical protein